MTKFSGSLPKGDLNGLTALSNQLLRNPKGTHIIVGVIDVKTITTDVDTADQTATVRFRRVEAIDPADADHAVRMMQRAAERRTGAAMLPIEMEDELRELMEALDFETGELFDTRDGEMVNPDVDPDTLADVEGDNPPAVPGEPDEIKPERPNRPKPAKETAPDESEAGDADAEPLPAETPAVPAETPSPEQETPAEAPKKKRGRPTKAEAAAKKAAAEAAAAAPPADLAAADVPRAPWDEVPAAGMYPDHEEGE